MISRKADNEIFLDPRIRSYQILERIRPIDRAICHCQTTPAGGECFVHISRYS